MPNIHNEEHKKLAEARVVAIAQRILSAELGIVPGARELSVLRFDVGAEDDPDLIFFVGVDSETDHLPVGDVRSHWNPEVLKAKAEELRSFEAFVRESAFAHCRSLIQKYGRRDVRP